MADESKELGRIGFDGETPLVREPIIVKLSSFKNSKYLDIRKYYDKDGEWCPTSKGVTLHREQIRELLQIITDNTNEIEQWFN
ncbi:MAG: transcriptional coactivator p15/PC4 family protein [Spirochaetales bacterium]|nr:transcriptional coactivator p15/PC4 family protein [Spirochaetales bacterium]